MNNLDSYLPGPWASAYGSGFKDLEETAESLFGLWLAHHVTSYEDLKKMLGGVKITEPKHLIRVEVTCSDFPDQHYEGYVVCEMQACFREAREDEL